MTIAEIGSLWQLLSKWWGALTLAGIGAFCDVVLEPSQGKSGS